MRSPDGLPDSGFQGNSHFKVPVAGGEGTDSYVLAWDNKPKSLLETTLNTRDLGGYRIAGTKKYTKYNRIYRSDLPKEPSEKDIECMLISLTGFRH